MDDFYYEEYDSPASGSKKMALAALILAALSVLISSAFYLAIPMAALSIILALLSRGNGRLGYRGKLAIMVSCAAIAISGVSTAILIYRIETTPALKQRLEYMIDQLYGDPYRGGHTAPYEKMPDSIQGQPDPLPDRQDLLPGILQWSIEGGEAI